MKKGLIIIPIILFLILAGSIKAEKVEPGLEEQLEVLEEVDVVVILKDDPARSEEGLSYFDAKKSMIKKQQENVLSRLNVADGDKKEGAHGKKGIDFRLGRKYSTVNGFAGKVTKSGLEKLREDPNVDKIRISRIREVFLSDSIPLINGNDAWPLQLNNTNLTGKYQTICIIDTGIDTDHGAFSSRILGQYCYCQLGGGCCPGGGITENSAEDDHGHGTHVAGIAAGDHSAAIKGVAWEAGIAAIKVCNSGGSCHDNDVIAGIDWCADNASKLNISVVSISLGDRSMHNSYCNDDNMAPAINSAVGQNITVVVSAGNCNWAGASCTSGITAPACIENATPAGAVNKDDAISYQRGNILSLLAPGVSITAPYIGGGTAAMSGTSMAAPHVSGSAALLNQFFKSWNNTNATWLKIRDVLNNTGKRIYDSGTDRTYSRIDVYAAIISQDNIEPNAAFISPPGNQTTANASIFVNATVNDTLKEDSCILEWNYTNHSMAKVRASGFIWCYLNKPINGTGTFYYRVYANDSSNNMGSTELREINITNTKPLARNLELSSTDSLNRTNGTLSAVWNFSDSNNDPWARNETRWYNNSVIFALLENLTQANAGNTSKLQNWTISVRVYDGNNWSNWTNASLTILDAAPDYSTGIPNQTWYKNVNRSINLSLYFSDIDADTLVFNSTTPSASITVAMDNGNATFIPAANWTGNTSIIFNASDGSSARNSTNITLKVTADLDNDGYNSTLYGGTDCDEGSPYVNPGKTEVCGNGIDDDCDGSTDEGCGGAGGGAGGGGGGGGGGGAAAAAATATSETINTGKVAGGGAAEAVFTASELGITQIRITVEKTVTASSITAINMGSNRGIATEAVTAEESSSDMAVQSYLKITIGKISNTNIKKAIVEFRISKKEGYDPATVELRRYDGVNRAWSSLPTSLIYQDSGHYYFEAETPGFSMFAIVGKKTGQLREVVYEDEEEKDRGEAGEGGEIIERIAGEVAELFAPEEKPARMLIVGKLVLAILGFIGIVIVIAIFSITTNKGVNFRKLEKEIEKLIFKGRHPEHIKRHLKKAGWHEHYVEHMVKGVHERLKQAEDYVVSSLAAGHREEAVKETLRRHGWSKRDIGHVFRKRGLN